MLVDYVPSAAGTGTVAVRYEGDDDFLGSSASLSHTVQPALISTAPTPSLPASGAAGMTGVPVIAPPRPTRLSAAAVLAALRTPTIVRFRAGRGTVGRVTNPPLRSVAVEIRSLATSTTTRRTRGVLLARGSASAEPERPRALRVGLTTVGRRQLARRRSVRAELRVRAVDQAGTTVTASRRVMLSQASG